MTVIVWDGKTLAADRRACYGSMVHAVTKIFRMPDGSLVAGSGDFAQVAAMVRWLRDGADSASLPAAQLTADYACILVIEAPDSLWVYEKGAIPFKVSETWFTIGSGREFARAALMCGKDAVGAVEVACQCSHDCGNGIDTLTL